METKNLYQINDIGSYICNIKESTFFRTIQGLIMYQSLNRRIPNLLPFILVSI